MKNPLTFNIESYIGAVFMALFGLFLVSLLFVVIRNTQNDIDIMSATQNRVKVQSVSETELNLMQKWIEANKIEVPEDQGYRYILRTYPTRPWLYAGDADSLK